MSDIQPEDSVSNVGSRTSTSSAAKLAALKVKLEYAKRRAQLQEEKVQEQARLEEEQVRLQEEQTLQRVRTENELEILSAEEEVAVAEAEIFAEEEQSVGGSQVKPNVSGHQPLPPRNHGGGAIPDRENEASSLSQSGES